MLTADEIPTPLVQHAASPPIVIMPVKAPGRFGAWTLAVRLARLGAAIAVGKLLRRSTPAERAVVLRSFFEEQGGLWIKAGQLLSLRTDVLSREMVDELANLTYQAQGFAPELARWLASTTLIVGSAG